VWWVQGFVQEEDVAFKKIVADYEKASGNKIDYSIIPFAPGRQKIVAAMTSGIVPDLFTNNGPKAGYRGDALQSSSLRRSTRGQAGSSIAVPPRPKTHRSRSRPWARKTRRGDPGGRGSTPVFLKSCQMTSPVKRECRLSPDTFPPIRGKVALRKRTAPRPAVAASRRAKASPLDG
jgi:hypothetical protein